MAVRFFVVLLPVRDLLPVAKHLFGAARMRGMGCRHHHGGRDRLGFGQFGN
jgi:hypothetical protein